MPPTRGMMTFPNGCPMKPIPDRQTPPRGPYLFGLVVCVLWPLLLELGLTRLPQGEASDPAVVQNLGHSFTGLVFLAAAFVFWRMRRIKGHPPDFRNPVLGRETLLASLLFAGCSVLGVLYYGLAGPAGERHARSFIAVVPIMFFVFVPRRLP